MKITNPSLLLAAACAIVAIFTSTTASAVLISSESFWTQAVASGGSYGNAGFANTSNPANNVVVAGNSGFSAGNPWLNSTGAVGPNSSSTLTGSVVPGSLSSGGAALSPRGVDRNSVRQLASTPVLSSSYYLSGLVNVGALTDLDTPGEYLACGFLGNTLTATVVDINTGFHFGVRNDAGTIYLAAFAGGTAYNLLALDGSTIANTYQIVLKLDVNASGTDTLTAWYATNNATGLTQGLAATSLNTWTGAGSLGYFALQSHSTLSDTGAFVNFDEMRFGTTLADVSTVPEPGTVALFVIGGLFVTLVMRKRKVLA